MKKVALVLALLLLGACSLNLFPKRDDWYQQHYIIMQDFEKKIYKRLSPQAKEQFQDLFWEARDSEAKMAFAERLDYVSNAYQNENKSQPWNTDRARIYLLNGNPAYIDYRDRIDWLAPTRLDTEYEDIQTRMDEVWIYPYENFLIYYRFTFFPPGEWRLDPSLYRDPFVIRLEQQSKDTVYAIIIDMEQYQSELDDLEKIK